MVKFKVEDVSNNQAIVKYVSGILMMNILVRVVTGLINVRLRAVIIIIAVKITGLMGDPFLLDGLQSPFLRNDVCPSWVWDRFSLE